jgi:hypothetical protein
VRHTKKSILMGNLVIVPGAENARCPVEYYGNPIPSLIVGTDNRNWYRQDFKLCQVVTEGDTKKCFEITNALGYVSFSLPICSVSNSEKPSCPSPGFYFNDVRRGPLDEIKVVRNTNAHGNNELMWTTNGTTPNASVHLACGPSDTQTFTCDSVDCSKIDVFIFTTNPWSCAALAEARTS